MMLRVAAVARPQIVRGLTKLAILLLGATAVLLPTLGRANDFCPDVYKSGVFPLNFNPAFMHIDKMRFADGNYYDGLIVTSFFNAIKNPEGTSSVSFFQRDLVARISGIGYRSPAWFNKDRDVEVLTDLSLPPVTEPLPAASGTNQQNWPNEAQRVPDGILPFEAIVSPQGFHPAAPPGRLTLINLDDVNRTEYLIDQSTQAPGSCRFDPNDPGYNEANQPRFYHLVKWADFDGDGLKDAVTVRSTFKVSGAFCIPGYGEVVWFKNPGGDIDSATPWEENVVAGFPNLQVADISLDVADLEGDGIPEVVGGAFFAGKMVTLYGAPLGESWVGVDPVTNPPRYAQISIDQGAVFGVRFVDLNRDGKQDVLATNHVGDDCYRRTKDPQPGRVYALEQPSSGDIFGDPWVTHILKDNIRPNPTFPAPNNDPPNPGRLAPGLAQQFWPTPWDEHFYKPWILVGGDEASQVWLLKPDSQDPNNWNYASSVIFDINDTYGANTTQSFSAPAPATGVSISTIGTPAWRYDRDWAWGSFAEIYIPVFEGRAIHRISFRPLSGSKKVTCPADTVLSCPLL